jgi:hypothetical protein
LEFAIDQGNYMKNDKVVEISVSHLVPDDYVIELLKPNSRVVFQLGAKDLVLFSPSGIVINEPQIGFRDLATACAALMINTWKGYRGWGDWSSWLGYGNGYSMIFQFLENPMYFSKGIEFDKDERNSLWINQLGETEREFVIEFDRMLRIFMTDKHTT